MIPLLLIVTVVVIALTMVFATWWMNFIAKHAIGGRHKQIEEIIETRRPPVKWMSGRGSMKQALVKLDKLIEYVKMSRFVDSEESRSILLADLSEIRAEWENETS